MSSNSGQSALDKLQARCLARDVTGIMEFGRLDNLINLKKRGTVSFYL